MGENTKKRNAAANASTWESFLEARKKPRCDSQPFGTIEEASSWGGLAEIEVPSKRESFSLDLQLGRGQSVHVEHGRRLAACAPGFGEKLIMSDIGSSSRSIDLTKDNLNSSALRAVISFLLAEKQQKCFAWGQQVEEDGELWVGGAPRPVALGARSGESQQVEDALHAFDILRVAVSLRLNSLEERAESLLLRSRLSDACVLPLFAVSFGTHHALSAACLKHLTLRSKDVLFGRERQLGVLYATHSVPAVVLSGVFKAGHQSGSWGASGQTRPINDDDRIVLDLVFGLGSGGTDVGICEQTRSALVH